MQKTHNPDLMVEVEYRTMTDDERETLRAIYVRHLGRLKVRPDGRGMAHSGRVMEARKATLGEALEALPAWREEIEWALTGGHYRVMLATTVDVAAGRAERQRSNRVAKAFANLQRRDHDLDPRWDADVSPESFIAFLLEAGPHVHLGALVPVEDRVGPGCYAIKRNSRVGIVNERPSADEVEAAWASIVKPVLAGREDEDELVELLDLHGKLSKTVQNWRMEHAGGVCTEWATLPTYHYIYTAFAYLIRHGLIRQPGQEYHRLDASLPWGPGNIGLRSRSANPYRLAASAPMLQTRAAIVANMAA